MQSYLTSMLLVFEWNIFIRKGKYFSYFVRMYKNTSNLMIDLHSPAVTFSSVKIHIFAEQAFSVKIIDLCR